MRKQQNFIFLLIALLSVTNDAANTEDTIPQRFIVSENNDMDKAQRRWDNTRAFREEHGLDRILNEPHPTYNVIVKMFPQVLCGTAKDGHQVYYEQLNKLNTEDLGANPVVKAEMKKTGLTVLELVLRHYLFNIEYMYNVALSSIHDGCENCEASKSHKILIVLDVVGFNLTKMKFLKRSVGIMGNHYPERSIKILLLNAPRMLSRIWSLVKPVLSTKTQEKVEIIYSADVQSRLQHLIEVDELPFEYGGTGSQLKECTYAKNRDLYVKRNMNNVEPISYTTTTTIYQAEEKEEFDGDEKNDADATGNATFAAGYGSLEEGSEETVATFF